MERMVYVNSDRYLRRTSVPADMNIVRAGTLLPSTFPIRWQHPPEPLVTVNLITLYEQPEGY